MPRQRSRRGTGSVAEVAGTRADGTKYRQGYRARATLPDGRRVSKTFRNSADAEAWLDTELDALRNNKPRPSIAARHRFGDAITAWRDSDRYATLAPKTTARYEQVIRTYLAPEIPNPERRKLLLDPSAGNLPMSAMTRQALKGYFAGLRRAGVSPGTVAKIRVTLSSILSEAVEDELIAANPLHQSGKRSRQQAKKSEWVILTAQEVGALAEECAMHRWQEHPAYRPQDRLAVMLAAHCGVRADELWALQRRDYNALKGTLTVERAWKTADRKPDAVGPTKTGIRRVVGLTSHVRPLLDEHMKSVPPEREAWLFTGPGGANGRATGEGGPVRHELWRARVFRPALKRALPHRAGYRFHDLRHVCASWLIASGADGLQVMKWMGHASIRTTYNVYGHLLDDHIDDTVLRLEALHADDNVTPFRQDGESFQAAELDHA